MEAKKGNIVYLGAAFVLGMLILGGSLVLMVNNLKSYDRCVTVKGLCEKEVMAKYGFNKRGAVNHGAEIAKLTVGGTNSILDIKKMLDAQFPNPDSLETITNYLNMLKEAGLVEF